MSKAQIEELVQAALSSLQTEQQLNISHTRLQIEATKDKAHGDFACNIALILAKANNAKPRDLAALIIKLLPPSKLISKVEIAGPGFINFFLSAEAVYSVIPAILAAKTDYAKTNFGEGKKILVEFVSSNPTGPLHVGHGRHASYGAVVCNLLMMIGYKPHREYYVNDAGRQMDIISVSVWIRYLNHLQCNIAFPANAYQGEYVHQIALALAHEVDVKLLVTEAQLLTGLPLDEPFGGDKELYIDAVIERAKQLLGHDLFELLLDFSLKAILTDIRDDLAEFGVEFDEWFSERRFVQTGAVERYIETLKTKDLVYEQDGALWFKAREFGDDKDRVLKRANGQPTYFANDFAYHLDKFARGFEQAIVIFGSDHHGYTTRIKAGLAAFGIKDDKLTHLLIQLVFLYRGGQQVSMSTRSGSFITLRELRQEVGKDVARFFYVMRKHEQHIDFDLDLAKLQSNENPVYYIQYAYARIASVDRQLIEKGLSFNEAEGLQHLALLTQPEELQLLSTLSHYKDMIISAAKQYEPHILTNYLRELAADFHLYYNSHQFLVANAALRQARLALVKATQQLLENGLQLLGVGTPQKM